MIFIVNASHVIVDISIILFFLVGLLLSFEVYTFVAISS